MATGFTKTEKNEVIKRLIKEREAKGLHQRNVPLPPRVSEGRRKRLRDAEEALLPREHGSQPSSFSQMKRGLEIIRKRTGQ